MTDYFDRVKVITDNELIDKIQKTKKLLLRNNSLHHNNVDNIIQTNNVENSHIIKILNISSRLQNLPETIP